MAEIEAVEKQRLTMESKGVYEDKREAVKRWTFE
ncbi:hypothetical protein CCACVL1_30753 [Corchorus capsularis]|uniref:Uncharacterized protein n=1 Tax=Corchorus capsularis TaxID=210143 RepID=A0A1R3FVN9_COCAP|nr:hypothetical protein CCACVL1_30753 [Corchorus capsularis]